MSTTNSIGTSGRDYSTVAAWLAAVPATPTGGYIGEMYNDSEFTAAITITGFTTSAANFIKLTTHAGQSFMDDAGFATNPQFYDQSKGVGVSVVIGAASDLLKIDDDYVTVEKLQLKGTSGNASSLLNVAFFISNVIVRNVIFAKTYSDPNDGTSIVMRAGLLANCLSYQTTSHSAEPAIFVFQATVVACAFINLGSAASTKAINDPFGGGTTFIDCAFFGWATDQVGTDPVTYSATDLASGFGSGTGNVYSLTLTTEYQSTSDFRLKSGNHMAAGQRQQTYTNDLDIVGQSRSTTTPCIGQWEFQAGGGDVLMGMILT